MNFKDEFEKIMKRCETIALATSTENIPSVRIVNFYYDTNKKTMYFTSFKNNKKVKEIEENPIVSFTTLIFDKEKHVKVKGVKVEKSDKSIFDLEKDFVGKIPSYAEIIEFGGKSLILYEIKLERVEVIIDYENTKFIQL